MNQYDDLILEHQLMDKMNTWKESTEDTRWWTTKAVTDAIETWNDLDINQQGKTPKGSDQDARIFNTEEMYLVNDRGKLL